MNLCHFYGSLYYFVFVFILLRTVLRTRTRTRIPAHAHAHAHTHTHWQLVKADRTCQACSLHAHDVERRLEMRTILGNLEYTLHSSKRPPPPPTLGAHLRLPRRCLRVCRPRVTRTPSRVKRPPSPTPGHYADAHPDLLGRSLPVPGSWARSLRMPERPVNHGASRGSLQPLAPTRAHVRARVPTHSPVTLACVRCCRHPSHAGGGEYSGIVFLSEAPLPAQVAQRISRAAARSEAELPRRDGPQPGYWLAQLCAAAHPGRPGPQRALLQLASDLMKTAVLKKKMTMTSDTFFLPTESGPRVGAGGPARLRGVG
jgi:hypothetical protein